MSELLTPQAPILDNQLYTVQSLVDPPNELRIVDAEQSLAAVVDLSTAQFYGAHGHWYAKVGHHLARWRVTIAPFPEGEPVAVAGPMLAGLNAYEIELGSDTRLHLGRNEIHEGIWHVRHHDDTILCVNETPGHRWTVETKNTGLSQGDLSVLICLALLLVHTNDIDNAADRAIGFGTTYI